MDSDENSLGSDPSSNEQSELLHTPPVPIEAIQSIQAAVGLYRSGKKLWIRSDLERIENELIHWRTTRFFTIRLINGDSVRVVNPIFGVANPAWRPLIQFQHYWFLSRYTSKFQQLRKEYPRTFPFFSYFVEWEQITPSDSVHSADAYASLPVDFALARLRWEESSTCDWLKRALTALCGQRRITKVICFGLGDLAPPSESGTQDGDMPNTLHEYRRCLNQHAVALTIASVARSTVSENVQVFTQDPAYSPACETVLRDAGVTVVGEYGAGGFSKIDNESAVFYCWPASPVGQMIADLARPALVIGNAGRRVITRDERHADFAFDTESPRSLEMWEGYTRHEFEIVEYEKGNMEGLNGLCINVRRAITAGEDQD
ncbi:hypothetical protein M426DRAFT_265444 [Hypoxylon sp. CI-4A]|nr:hypothetical protein M426DRAFT_265444 [Hypoxylon sp. CI-4A]